MHPVYCTAINVVMTNPNDKIIDRIRKLLELSHSDNEHEAAQAAARAAQMMSENAVTEAMLQVVADDDVQYVPERIITSDGPTYDAERRVAWRDRIASAVARSFGCECYYLAKGLHAIGRESAVQSWTYTCQYLFAEIERLADAAWLTDGADLAAVGQTPRQWKGAFRLGAADVVHERLYRDVYARQAKEREQAKAEATKALPGGENVATALVRVEKAIEIIAKDRAQVQAAFKERTKGFRSTRTMGNSTRRRGGYSAGREAGHSISLGGGKALKS